MPLELHVLGPAFGLPSIDAECTAAIALLSLRYGHGSSQWRIVQAHTSIETLPRLIDGSQSISGFSNICHHLRTSSKTTASADGIALTSLIHSRAPALISAYLYLSYENYSTTTRPAFTPILPFHARFIVPGALRAAAKERTAQLGISSLDIEQLDDKRSTGEQRSASESAFEATAPDRPSLVLPQVKTVRSLLAQKPESMAAFKLRDLSDALLEPLQVLLGQSDYFSGKTEPGAVDCLAFAYLSLMLSAPVPQPWLRTIIKEHYPGLERYVERLRRVLALDGLPPTHLTSTTFQSVALSIASALRDQAAVFQEDTIMTQSSREALFVSRHLASTLFLAGSALVVGAAWTFWPALKAPRGAAIQIFGQRPPAAFSHVSAALSGLDFLMTPGGGSQTGSTPHVSNDDDIPARVGIEIES